MSPFCAHLARRIIEGQEVMPNPQPICIYIKNSSICCLPRRGRKLPWHRTILHPTLVLYENGLRIWYITSSSFTFSPTTLSRVNTYATQAQIKASCSWVNKAMHMHAHAEGMLGWCSCTVDHGGGVISLRMRHSSH